MDPACEHVDVDPLMSENSNMLKTNQIVVRGRSGYSDGDTEFRGR